MNKKYTELTSSMSYGRTMTELYEYAYDHAGRVLNTFHTLNGGKRMQIAKNTYDVLGRLSLCERGDIADLATSYNYNIRNWLTGITNGLVNQRMYYNKKRDMVKSVPQWNGNISSYSIGDSSYDYSYDEENRLIGSYSTEIKDTEVVEGLHNTSYAYDDMGNILSIQRDGINIDTEECGKRDDVIMEYIGNQLVKVTNSGYKDSSYDMQVADDTTLSGPEYAYDANGNVIKDANKGIYLIKYNVLNLPEDIYSKNGNWHYTYDGDGNKVSVSSVVLKTPIQIPSSQIMDKHFTDTELESYSVMTERVYLGDYVYEFTPRNRGLELVRLNFSGGYVAYPMTTHQYNFYVCDHLGNNRYMYNASNLKVSQVNNYYPFGALYSENSNNEMQRWRYGNKELDRSFDTYDFLARWYDPTLCRFLMIDPMAEKYPWFSPYVYCANSPMNASDPTGKYLIYNYVNSDGQSTRYFYKQGEDGTYDFYDVDGNLYNHNEEFVSQLKSALNSLQDGVYGAALVSGLVNSNFGVNLKESKNGENKTLGNTVFWNPYNYMSALDVAGGKQRAPFVGLAHELAHTYDSDINKFYDIWQSVEGKDIYEGEKYATFWENQIRLENNIPMRKYYMDDINDNFSNPTLLLDSKGRHKYYYSIPVTIFGKTYITVLKK